MSANAAEHGRAAAANAAGEGAQSMSRAGRQIKMFLCGDVMTGRGIDQAMAHPGNPRLYEPWVTDARDYLRLAEQANGKLPQPIAPTYVWGDALGELEREAPAVRIANLETAVTTAGNPWPGKGIHYRMHPANIACLTAAHLDVGTLANNHVLDWGREGLIETLERLHAAGIATTGAGRALAEAVAPAIVETPEGRVLVFAVGTPSSGIPASWAATTERAGVCLAETLAEPAVAALAARIMDLRRPGDIVVVSMHWGGNWGYELPPAHRSFAHALIDRAGVDCVHGHSSHHPLGIELYRRRLILYGCGDFLNDYEGIRGYEEYRPELTSMYFPRFDAASGELLELALTPMRIRRLQVVRPSLEDARWLAGVLAREGDALGTRVFLGKDAKIYVASRESEAAPPDAEPIGR